MFGYFLVVFEVRNYFSATGIHYSLNLLKKEVYLPIDRRLVILIHSLPVLMNLLYGRFKLNISHMKIKPRV